MRTILNRGLIVVSGVLLAASLTHRADRVPRAPDPPPAVQPAQEKAEPEDPRLARLTRFFARMKSPLVDLAEDFLEAADRYNLDWRLLPSISIVETGGGRICAGNNIFGWDAGQHVFASVSEAIEIVAARLGTSRLYRDKDLPDKLGTYNGDPEYADLVQSVMQRVAPDGATATPPAPAGDHSISRTPR